MRLAWPLTGRLEESRLIDAALASTELSGIVIYGSAGVGKSRIAREALAVAGADGYETRWTVGTSAAQGLPLGTFARWVGTSDADSVALVGRVIDGLIVTSDGRPVLVCVDDAHLLDGLSGFVLQQIARAGAETGVDRALRLDTTVMLVDDPVKRVDNMTMSWGLEGRVPFLDHELVELAASCPPQLKTAHGGKGVLKEAARRVIPAEVIDRPKGYFPVPALTHLEGPYLDLVRDALYAPQAKERGLFRPEAVERLLADPNGRLTPLRGNELWQIAVLELWLQRQGITGPAA